MNTNQSRKRLLLIDDTLADLRILTEIATRRGWSVTVAFNGKDGINKARMAHFDLILLDVRMPGLDGFGTCRLLKADERCRNTPVIFLSALGDQDNRLEGLLLGAVDYIVKEYANEDEIAARIAVHLHTPQTRTALHRLDSAHPMPFAALLHAAEKMMLNHLAEDLSVGKVAESLGVSERKLNDAFRQAYGKTAFVWLREEKLRIARQMLAKTDASISDIALNLGYSSSQNFATAFRERFRCTPKEFRNGIIKQTVFRRDQGVSG